MVARAPGYPRPVTPVLRGLAGSVARGRSHTGPPRFRGAWLDFLSPPGAPRRGAQPRGEHLMLGEVSAARPAARTGEKGAASGEPAVGPRGGLFSLRRPFQPLFGISCLEVGQTEKRAAVGP